MKVVEVVVSRSVRVNLGDYQSLDSFVSMRAEVGDGDKSRDAARKLRALVDRALIDNLAAHFRERGKPLSPSQIAQRFGLCPKSKEIDK